MEEKFETDSVECIVSITRVVLLDGKEMHRLIVSHLPGNSHVDLLFQTYNGAVIGLFRLLSNNMAAV